MKHNYKLLFILFIASILSPILRTNNAEACDRTSITITNVTTIGSTYYYTAQVCLGISPNWGATTNISIDADQTITSITSGAIAYSYEYCSKSLTYNGQPCASGAGGTVLTANVNVTPSISGGNISISSSNPWLAPDDLRGDCRDCSNGSNICFTVSFTTTTPITTIQLNNAEGSGTVCPDEIDASIPVPPAACTAPAVSAATSTASVCQGQTINLSATCTSNCIASGGSKTTYSWTGPGGYTSTTEDPSLVAGATGGTYTVTASNGTCVGISASVNVTVTPLPTATLATSAVDNCTAVSVPINLTGTAPWTVQYRINGGAIQTANCASSPCYISVPQPGGTVALVAGSVNDATSCSSGTTSGTTTATTANLSITGAADWTTPTVGGTYSVTNSYTGGLDSNQTALTPVVRTNSTTTAIPNPGSTAASNLTLSGLSGANTCPLNINSIDDICINYTHPKASRDVSATLTCTGCTGVTSISLAAGSFPNCSSGPCTVCFSYGDVLTMLDGEPCNVTLSLVMNDGNSSGGSNAGSINGWNITSNNVAVTPIPDTYSWAATSGTANVSYLSCTNCLSPTFTAPAAGTAAGCYTLTITDAQGCTRTEPWCYGPILAVKLTEFKVEAHNDGMARLLWETAREENNKEFVLERSANGKEFHAIHKREGKQSSTDRVSYEYIDENPLNGVNYYRIKMVDNDGSFTFSETKNLSIKAKSQVRVYPVPATKNITVELANNGTVEDIQLTVSDVSGKTVKQMNLKNDEAYINLNISDIAPGTYNFTFQNTVSGNKEIKKVVVQ